MSRLIPWSDVYGIERASLLGGVYVRVRLQSGITKRLFAPVTGFTQDDPDFDTKLEAIREWNAQYGDTTRVAADTFPGVPRFER